MASPQRSRVLVTGATGFVGRRLLGALADRDVVALARDPGALADVASAVQVARGDLTDPASLDAALEAVDTVVHLAARTGKASARELHATNVEGTAAILAAAGRAGARRIVFVSSIAATYPDKRAYPYARSKEEGEQLVRGSGLHHVILRPTIVLGTGSPIGRTLRGFASAPVLPLLGPARTRIQPVHVDDVVAAIAAALAELEAGRLVEGSFDVAGPDPVTFHELLRRLATTVRGGPPRAVPVPIGLAVKLLALVEPVALPVLPVTAGQLSAFLQDGVATTPALPAELPAPRSLAAMIEETASDG